MLSVQLEMTDISQPKKRRKSGGSFCAVGGCTNNSYRDLESAINGRGFLRFYRLPKEPQRKDRWVARMRRQFGWKPSEHTKICSDHFHESDFIPSDLNKHRENQNLTVKKRHLIRLKNDATPNTNRVTGHYSDPLDPSELANERPLPSRNSSKNNESSSLELESTDVTVAALEQKPGDDDNDDRDVKDNEIMDMEFEHILQAESDSNDDEFSDTDSDTSYQPETMHEILSDNDNDEILEDEDLLEFDDVEVTFSSILESFLSNDPRLQWIIVYIPYLLSLFNFCPQCGSPCRIVNVSTKGFAVCISYICSGLSGVQHRDTWRSSPVTKRYFDINLKLPAMATMCGLGYSLLENVMIGLKMPYIGSSGFFKNIRLNLYPVIANKWKTMRESLIQNLGSAGRNCDVAGDCHYDTPGLTSKYCWYSIMDIDSGAIIDFFVCQRAMYSGDLETESAKEVLTNLIASGLNIKRFVTDENRKVAKMVKDNFTKVMHCYDVGRKARMLRRKLVALAKTHTELGKWKTTIVNHFWYSCQKCGGDPEVVLEKFHSCLLHICDKHSWGNDPFLKLKEEIQKENNKTRKKALTEADKRKLSPGLPHFNKEFECPHAKRMQYRGVSWLDMDGDAYKNLFRYLTDARFCNSLKKCSQFLHTGGLEAYHDVMLKFLPKRTSCSLVKTIIAGMLVCIEVNSNLDVARKSCWKWSRSQNKYVSKQRILKKNYSFRDEILNEMMKTVMADIKMPSMRDTLEGYYIKRQIPQRMVPKDIPICSRIQGSRFA